MLSTGETHLGVVPRSELTSQRETWTYRSISTKEFKRLRELGLFTSEKRRPKGILTKLHKYTSGVSKENGARLFFLVLSDRT